MRPPPVVHCVFAGYTLGVCLALAWSPGAATLAVAALIATAWLCAGGRLTRRGVLSRGVWGTVVLLVPLVVVCGLTAGTWRLSTVARSGLAAFVSEYGDTRCTVLALPSRSGDRLAIDVRVTSFDGRAFGERARLELDVRDAAAGAVDALCDPVGGLVEGTLLEVREARVDALPEPKPGEFDYGRYLERRGEHVVLAAALDDCTVAGRRGGLAGALDALRVTSRRHLRTGMRPPLREVLEAMVLGDDNGVDEQVVADFRNSGLLHIMAVSGENVVLLCAIFGCGLRLVGVPRAVRTAVLIPLVVTYVIVTGASPSIMRAGVAGVCGLLAALVSRPADGWLLWLAPAAALLSINPNALFDVSFQLSFAAVAGLLLLSRRFTALAARLLPPALAESAGVTAAASISTAPVSLIAFGQTSLVSVAANVAAGFSLGPIMMLGMASVLAGFVSPLVSQPLNVLAGLCIGFLLSVSAAFGRLPWAVYEWHGLTLSLCLAAGALAEALGVWALARRDGVTVLAYVVERRRRGGLALVTAAVVALALVGAPAAPAPPGTATLTFLSVGEGAATLLQVPHGPTVLIDAGPAPLFETLRRHGVRRIDLLVLSHGHADHSAGLSDVLGHIPITRALVPADDGQSPSLAAVRAELAAAGVPVTSPATAVSLAQGDVRLDVMPTQGGEEGGNQGENDRALVCVVTLAGERVLVPGDAEGDVLVPLGLGHCDVVELPHHGSAGGFADEQVAALAPSLAVISVGENRFGHPTAAMLALMARHGVPVLRTDAAGEVRLDVSAGGLEVATQRATP